MRVNKDEYLTRAFVLTPDELKKLENAIQVFTQISSVKIGCSDKLDREFSSIDELLTFENPPNKEIKSLRIFTFNPHSAIRLTLRFDSDNYRNVYFSIEGEEQIVTNFSDQLQERFSAIRPWYSLPIEGLFRSVLLVIIVGYLLYQAISTSIIKFLISHSIIADKPPNYTQIIWGVVLFSIFALALYRVLFKLRDFAFPTGVFAIGQGAKRHNDKEIFRTVVILGIIVSIIASLITILFFG